MKSFFNFGRKKKIKQREKKQSCKREKDGIRKISFGFELYAPF